jgi:hypothetical protein
MLMGRKKKRKPDNPEQSAKFIELAKQVKPVTEEMFQEAFTRVAKVELGERPKKKTERDPKPT